MFDNQDSYNDFLTLFDSEEEMEQYFADLEQMQAELDIKEIGEWR